MNVKKLENMQTKGSAKVRFATLLKSFLGGAFLFGILALLILNATPAENHAFLRLPLLQGSYSCCDAGGKSSRSLVGEQQIDCINATYIVFGTGRADCGLKELSGKTVAVQQALVPNVFGPIPVVVSIEADGVKRLDRSDAELRRMWINNSWSTAVVVSLVSMVVLCCSLQIIGKSKN